MCHQDTKTIMSRQSLRKRLASFPPVFFWGVRFSRFLTWEIRHASGTISYSVNLSVRVSKEQAKRLATGNSELAAP